jgi:hypothetical protein
MGATRRKVRNFPELHPYTLAKVKQQRSAALVLITGIQSISESCAFWERTVGIGDGVITPIAEPPSRLYQGHS